MNKVSESEAVDFLKADVTAFGQSKREYEWLAPAPESQHHSVAETWWFNALVPEQDFVASFYICIRRNLNMCAAGTWMWRGFKAHQLHADHFNYHTFAPSPVVEGNKLSVPTVGLSYEILVPLETTRIIYRSPDGRTTANLSVRQMMPAAVRANNKHFEAGTWVTGEIVVEGEALRVDGPAFRDRSWGEPRPEDSVVGPPIGWLCGVLDQGRAAFNLSGFDDPAKGAEWAGVYNLPPNRLLLDGWIYKDGKLLKVVEMSKRTHRVAAERMRPSVVEVEFKDSAGGKHELLGRARNGFGMHHWPNIYAWFGLTAWELDGLKGFGETQDYLWADYCKRYWPAHR